MSTYSANRGGKRDNFARGRQFLPIDPRPPPKKKYALSFWWLAFNFYDIHLSLFNLSSSLSYKHLHSPIPQS